MGAFTTGKNTLLKRGFSSDRRSEKAAFKAETQRSMKQMLATSRLHSEQDKKKTLPEKAVSKNISQDKVEIRLKTNLVTFKNNLGSFFYEIKFKDTHIKKSSEQYPRANSTVLLYEAAVQAFRELYKLGLQNEEIVVCASNKNLWFHLDKTRKTNSEKFPEYVPKFAKIKEIFPNIQFQYIVRKT